METIRCQRARRSRIDEGMEEDWRLFSKEPEGAEATGVKEEAAQAEAMGVAPRRGTL